MNAIKGKANCPPPLRSHVRASLLKGEDMCTVFYCSVVLAEKGGRAALCPLLTTSEPYLASPLNSPADILFIKSFHILLSPVPLHILSLSEV